MFTGSLSAVAPFPAVPVRSALLVDVAHTITDHGKYLQVMVMNGH